MRLVRDDEGHWLLDERRRAGGRGAWVCRDDLSCHAPKRLGRHFRADAERVAALLARASDAEPHPTEG